MIETRYIGVALVLAVLVLVPIYQYLADKRVRRSLIAPARPMGMAERAFDCMHQMGAFVIVQVVLVEGDVQAHELAHALEHLQRKQPLLRVHVAGPDGLFRASGTTAIPVKEVPRVDDDSWKEVAEVEIHTPIPYGTSPLLHVIWVRGEQRSELVLKSNHAILDGASAVAVTQDLLAACARLREGKALGLPSVAAEVQPLDTLLPRSAEAPLPKEPFLKFSPKGVKASREHRRTRIVYHYIPKATSERLQARCRAENTTVHGAISAAAALALCNVIDADAITLSSNVSVRALLVPKVAMDVVGCFISGVTTFHENIGNRAFWDLAREIRTQVSSAVEQGLHLRALFRPFRKLHALALRHLVPNINFGRINTLNVSNSGRFLIPTVYGPFALRGLYAFSGQHVLGSVLHTAIMSIDDAMFLCFAYPEPLLFEEHAQEIVRRFDHLVTEASAPRDWVLENRDTKSVTNLPAASALSENG